MVDRQSPARSASALLVICGLVLAATTAAGCRPAPAPVASAGFPLVEKWRFKAGGEILTTLGAGSGVVVARTGREVVALDPRTGSLRWRRGVPRSILPLPARTPVLAGEGVVVVVSYQAVMALDSRDGTVLWQDRRKAPTDGAFPAAITLDSVYVVGYDVTAYERTTGAVRWRVSFPEGRLKTAGVFPDQDEVFLSLGGRLQARRAAGGALLWEDTGDLWPPVAMALGAGKLYHCVGAGGVVVAAFDVASRKDVWQTPVEAASCGSPLLLASGRLFLAPVGRPLALDAETGAILWQSTIQSGRYQGPALLGGAVYVREQFSRVIYALSAEDGTELGHLTTGNSVWFPTDVPFPLSPITADGLLLFAAGDTVYAYGE